MSLNTGPDFTASLAQCWEEFDRRLRAKCLVDSETEAVLSDKYLRLCLGSQRDGLRDLSRRLNAKVDRRSLRRLADFRWLSSRGAYVLGGLPAAALFNAWAFGLRKISEPKN